MPTSRCSNTSDPASRATPPRLSKSRIQSGLQCPLRLWYDSYEPQLASAPDESLQFILDRGTKIGELARERYAGGKLIDASYRETERALEQTRAALLEPSYSALFEPAFQDRGVLVRVDVLARSAADSWELIEVKSAARLKEAYLRDVAIQQRVLTGAGLRIDRAGVLLLNTSYVYDGEQLDLQQLFNFHDLSHEVDALHDELDKQIVALQAMLCRPDPPAIVPGAQCHDPYECPYVAHCSKDEPCLEHPISNLPRLHPNKRLMLEEMGIREIGEIPEDFPLKEAQARARQCVLSGEEWVSDDLAYVLNAIDYPVHHLDFEALMPAIPRYAGMRPYENAPFQYSIHREEQDGQITPLAYLCRHRGDPRRELSEQLLSDLGAMGSICVYSSFERNVISRLAEWLPDLRDPLLALTNRLWDLLPIIRQNYYHPGLAGSFSIKRVLPVLVPELSYNGMRISDGMAAAFLFEKSLDLDDETERSHIFEDLLTYCGQDTLAMVRLRQELANRAAKS